MKATGRPKYVLGVDSQPRNERLNDSYAACRDEFRSAAQGLDVDVDVRRLEGHGRDGEELTIDTVHLGATRPRAALLVLSGVHGVEGFAGSAQQCDLLRSDPRLPAETACVVVHAVNPWGMSWWRRQNESNVDLNRNWQDFDEALPGNEPYTHLHDLLCPSSTEVPETGAFVEGLSAASAEHGLDWVRAAVSGGQYTHADGLYFGGERREASTRHLESIAVDHLAGVEDLLIVDLHTGHGPHGTCTMLTRAPMGSDDDRWLRATFAGETIEATNGDPTATSAPKKGQLTEGLLELLSPAVGRTTTLELGTRSETRMIVAERQEHWLHRFGDRSSEVGRELEQAHFECSIPPEDAWHRSAREHGARVLGKALASLEPPR